MTATPLRPFYVDDSGAGVPGFATFSWIELKVEDWKPGLRQVLDWRKRMMAEHQIPPLYELHATKFANGRGNPSLESEWNRKKASSTPAAIISNDAVTLLIHDVPAQGGSGVHMACQPKGPLFRATNGRY